MQTIGYNPYRLEERIKQLLLIRLVPFVESNYNLIELGPRETGKTYMYKNTSPRAFVVSSGKSTPATLFYHKARKRVGIIGVKDVVVFDEVAREGEGEPKFDAETIDTLKMFMQSGQYTRDNIEFTSPCSVVLGGNINTDTLKQAPVEDYNHLFAPLPAELRHDTAFLDRIHAYLPGWEVPKQRNVIGRVFRVSSDVQDTHKGGRDRRKEGYCVGHRALRAGRTYRHHAAFRDKRAPHWQGK